jgi:hypothetical protein
VQNEEILVKNEVYPCVGFYDNAYTIAGDCRGIHRRAIVRKDSLKMKLKSGKKDFENEGRVFNLKNEVFGPIPMWSAILPKRFWRSRFG